MEPAWNMGFRRFSFNVKGHNKSRNANTSVLRRLCCWVYCVSKLGLRYSPSRGAPERLAFVIVLIAWGLMPPSKLIKGKVCIAIPRVNPYNDGTVI